MKLLKTFPRLLSVYLCPNKMASLAISFPSLLLYILFFFFFTRRVEEVYSPMAKYKMINDDDNHTL